MNDEAVRKEERVDLQMASQVSLATTVAFRVHPSIAITAGPSISIKVSNPVPSELTREKRESSKTGSYEHVEEVSIIGRRVRVE